MKTLIVYRLSAMGDVAMLLPILRGVLNHNPDYKIVLVTRPFFAKFFAGIDRLETFAVDLDAKHKGIKGMLSLALSLKKRYKPTAFFDLHAVLRSFQVSRFLKLMGVSVYTLKKERKAKKKAIATKDFSQPFKTTFERYTLPFKQFGLQFEPVKVPVFGFLNNDETIFNQFSQSIDWKATKKIGIAPFAKHKQKMWPKEHVTALIEKLEEKFDCAFFFYGGGAEELAEFEKWSSGKTNRFVAANLKNIHHEINLMAKLDVMLAMDSGNMHFASLAGTPVFSIWGGTSPLLGFSPYQVEKDFLIEPPTKFDCRPCSVFGAKPCIYPDKVRCMHSITPDLVFKRIKSFFDKKF